MPATEIPKAAIDINSRFFQAVDYLVETKQIRGLKTLATLWDVSRFSLTWSKNHPEEKRLKLEYLYYIARDYDISLNWLFFGKGEMIER